MSPGSPPLSKHIKLLYPALSYNTDATTHRFVPNAIGKTWKKQPDEWFATRCSGTRYVCSACGDSFDNDPDLKEHQFPLTVSGLEDLVNDLPYSWTSYGECYFPTHYRVLLWRAGFCQKYLWIYP